MPDGDRTVGAVPVLRFHLRGKEEKTSFAGKNRAKN
jgi:hypothetical protein